VLAGLNKRTLESVPTLAITDAASLAAVLEKTQA